MPHFQGKKTQFQQKKHFLTLLFILREYFVYLFYTKYPFLTCLKLLTTLSVFFDILNTSNFTNCQIPLMTIVSHKI